MRPGGRFFKLYAKLPKDDVGAEKVTLRASAANGITLGKLIHLMAGVYNTIGDERPFRYRRHVPQGDPLDRFDVVEEEYEAMGAFKNGPRLWTLDWVEVMVGKERDFNGLKARWVAWLHVPKEMRKHESVATRSSGSTRARRRSSLTIRRATRGA